MDRGTGLHHVRYIRSIPDVKGGEESTPKLEHTIQNLLRRSRGNQGALCKANPGSPHGSQSQRCQFVLHVICCKRVNSGALLRF